MKTVKEIGCHVVPKPSTDNVVKLHTGKCFSLMECHKVISKGDKKRFRGDV